MRLPSRPASQDSSIEALAERTAALREGIERLAAEVRDGLSAGLGEAESGAERLLRVGPGGASPKSAGCATPRSKRASGLPQAAPASPTSRIGFTPCSPASTKASARREARLAELTSAIGEAQGEAASLTAETGPALVAALVQVREAAAHAAERAREAIASGHPRKRRQAVEATREALESSRSAKASRSGCAKSRQVAARAVETARAASDRLTQQMLNLGQSAAALDQHIEETEAAQREKDSEAFARRVSLLIDSMHSAAIDVGKILSDEIDDKAWIAYLKGNRGVFTRRAVQLLGGSEAKRDPRPLREPTPSSSIRSTATSTISKRCCAASLAERDGGMMAVTLMSSDMGKLYAALAQAIERR